MKEKMQFCTFGLVLLFLLLMVHAVCSASTIQLPENLAVIGEEAFMGDQSISEVIVPESVREIGKNAFNNCTGLTSLDLPERLLSIEEGAFDGCPLLTIFGYTNSLADRYAAENQLPFTSMGIHTHQWDEGTVTVAPTALMEGEKVYTCVDCGFTRTETMDATLHGVSIDAKYFPDDILRSYVSDYLDENNDFWLSPEELIKVEEISIAGDAFDIRGLVSTTGIEYFPCLKKLDVSYTNIQTLDVSHNSMLKELNASHTRIQSLDLSQNLLLEELNVGVTALPNLDITANTQLKKLYCYTNNWSDWSQVDISQNILLEELDITNNQFETLAISHLAHLRVLNVSGNSLMGKYDFSSYSMLEYININRNLISGLDVSNLEHLKELYATETILSYINAANCISLEYLETQGTTSRQVLLTLDNVKSLKEFRVPYSKYANDSLDLSNSLQLEEVWVDYSKLTELNLTNCPVLERLVCRHGNITSLQLSGCYALKILDCQYNNITELNLGNFSALSYLNCTQCVNLANLNLSQCTSLKDLECSRCVKLPALDIADCPNLMDIECNQCPMLSELNVVHCSSLRFLRCEFATGLTSLDLRNLTALEELTFWGCGLTEVKLANNESLRICYANSNRLTSFDLTQAPAIELLSIKGNLLTELDVSCSPELVTLLASSNNLKSLDIRNHKKLKRVEAETNKLTAFCVSGCTELQKCYINNNDIAVLDLSGCNVLKELYAEFTNIQSVDLTDCTALEILWLGFNKLTSVDLSGLTNLKQVRLLENPLTSLSVPDAPLETFYWGGGEYTIDVDDITFDLSTLPGNFDPACAFDWVGGTADGNILTLDVLGDSLVSYNYYADPAKERYVGTVNLIVIYHRPHVDGQIDEQSFPCLHFRNYVLNNIDTDSDGILSQEEINAVKELDLRQYIIWDLQGIEYFTELEKLNISGCIIGKLDLGANTKLLELDCSWNRLGDLNISGCTNLTKLITTGNSLHILALTNFPNLQYLNCSYSGLYALDVSGCPALETLDCSMNNIPALDVGYNSLLKVLNCSSNPLASLDISNCIGITSIQCDNCNYIWRTQSVSLALDELPGFDPQRANNWTGATVTENALILSGNENTITYTYDIDGANGDLEQSFAVIIDRDIYYAINEANFPDHVLRAKMRQFDSSSDGWLSQNEIEQITEINLDESGLSDLTGIEYLTALQVLQIKNNTIPVVNVSQNTLLEVLDIQGSGVQNLTINTNLKVLNASDNQLTSMQLDGHPLLEGLSAYGNPMTDFSISNCPSLTSVSIPEDSASTVTLNNVGFTRFHLSSFDGDCPLRELNITNCPALETLELWVPITSLDITGCTGLKNLTVHNEPNVHVGVLNTIAGTNSCVSLEVLDCSENAITELDLSSCVNLKELICYSNSPLSSINIQGLSSLEIINARYTALTELDVSNLPSLRILSVEGTKMTSIDVSANPLLESLAVGRTPISSLDVSACPLLKSLSVLLSDIGFLDLSNNHHIRHIGITSNPMAFLDLTPCDLANNFDLEVSYAFVANPYILHLNSNRITADDLPTGFDMSRVYPTDPGYGGRRYSEFTIEGDTMIISLTTDTLTYAYDLDGESGDLWAYFDIQVIWD